MKPLTFGSLFAGIGGFDLGLERAGMACKWQVEIDPFCRKVLEKHWPGVPKYGDIREITGSELEPVDLICGGFPCQPVSVAGQARKQEDDRWLWPETHKIICSLRPRFVLLENVPGLLVRGMHIVLGDLAAIGFDAEWSVFRASEMGGGYTIEQEFTFWPTPKASEPKRLSFRPDQALKTQFGNSVHSITNQMLMLCGLYPTAEFSGWLMGFPKTWTHIRDTETP